MFEIREEKKTTTFQGGKNKRLFFNHHLMQFWTYFTKFIGFLFNWFRLAFVLISVKWKEFSTLCQFIRKLWMHDLCTRKKRQNAIHFDLNVDFESSSTRMEFSTKSKTQNKNKTANRSFLPKKLMKSKFTSWVLSKFSKKVRLKSNRKSSSPRPKTVINWSVLITVIENRKH